MNNTIYDATIINVNDCFQETEKGTIWYHDKFGSFLINKLNIYSKNDCIYMYKNGIYVRNENDILRAIQYYCKNAKENFRKEVNKYIQIAAPVMNVEDNVNLIGCKNGIYDISTGELFDYDKKYFMQHKINAQYNPDAYSESIDKMLNRVSCNNPKIRALIEEMIGYTLYRNCRYQKIFLLRGFGKNGKSTLIEAILQMLGEENCSALSLNDLQDKFKKPELQDKLANICDDLSNAYIKDTEDFKKIATGGIMTMERKNQAPFKYRNYAKLIMCANEIPKSADKSEGYYRRFVIIPLDAKISENDPDFDANINDKITTEESKSYLLNLAISGLKRLLDRGFFETFNDIKKEIEEYKADNDPIIAFVNDYTIKKLDGQKTDFIFSEFCDWYKNENNKFSTYTKTTFSRTLSRVFSITTTVRNGVRVYVYTDENSNTSGNTSATLCSEKIQSVEQMKIIEDEALPF